MQKNFKKIKKSCKKVLTKATKSGIILALSKATRESGGTGRRARLRGVWIHRTGSSPVSRTKGSVNSEPFSFSLDNKSHLWYNYHS